MGTIIEVLKVILLGIVEGITEWLPISSTGHLILVNQFVNLRVEEKFLNMFNVVIQLGAILAVVVLFFPKLWPFSPNKTQKQRNDVLILWTKVIVGCVPAGIAGILLNDWMEEKIYNAYVVSAALILYGIVFIVIENINKHKKFKVKNLSQITYSTALLVGLFQMLSLVPGTSRSGSTIIGGMILGLSRGVAAEYSFFMSIPVMCGASLLKMLKFGFSYTGEEILFLITGTVVSFLVSLFAIKFLMGYIKRNDFKAFGYYRIILGIIVLVYFLLTKSTVI